MTIPLGSMPNTPELGYHSDDEEKENSRFLRDSQDTLLPHFPRSLRRMVPRKWRSWTLGAVMGSSMATMFFIGYLFGAAGPHRLITPSIASPETALGLVDLDPPSPSVFDALKLLPPLDLWKEYGLNASQMDIPAPLGKKVCIINVDTRAWDFGQNLEAKNSDTWGWLNHYMYARLHGYDYKYIQVHSLPNQNNHWVKMPELHRVLMTGDYEFVVLTDTDVLFPDLRLPLEVLFSHWNVTADIALAAPLDPTEDFNRDTRGKINLNSGFVIAQNTSDFNQIMVDWINCPTNVKYPDCNRFLNKGAAFHDQSALSEYIRYDYPNSIREIPFFEANGCDGKFVQHLWCNKGGVADTVRRQFARLFMPSALQELLANWDYHHIDMVKWPKSALPGVSTSFTDLPRPTPTPTEEPKVEETPAATPVEATPEPTPVEASDVPKAVAEAPATTPTPAPDSEAIEAAAG